LDIGYWILWRRLTMNARKSYRPLLLVGVSLVLAALACNVPGAAIPATEIPPTATTVQVVEASPTSPSSPVATDAPVATDTPVPDVSGPGGCTLNARYVSDVTVPDNTEFDPGEAFTKVWRVRNSGTCAWETGSQLVFISGEQLDGPAAVDVPAVAPGSTTDASVDLTAPTEPGTYRGNWQLQGPDGARFGSVIYVQIVVPSPATETPTATPTITATATTTPTTVPEPFTAVWEALGGEDGALGAPTGEAVTVRWMADQQFEQGYMYWRNNEGASANRIYVLYYQGGTDPSQGTWNRYKDTWTEEMDEVFCPEAETPNGPLRGFGKVWCDNESVRLSLGAVTEPEVIYAMFANGTWQRFHEAP
jgi:hypothetical protein